MMKSSGHSPTLVRDLGRAGASWMCTSLQDGLTLSRTFLNRRGRELDHALTIVPGGIEAEEVAGSLERAQLLPLAESDRHLTRILVEEGPPSALLVVEDDLGRAGDPVLEQVENRVLYVGEEVYHLFEVVNDPTLIGTALCSGSGFPLNAFVFPSSTPLPADHQLSTAALEGIVDSAAFVVVMGFDAGGYVFWKASS